MTPAPPAALFRLFAPERGGHHYVVVRERGPGVPRSVLLRRGLVWGIGETAAEVSAPDAGPPSLVIAEGSERRAVAPTRPIDDLDDFAVEAIGILARHLGVPPAEIRPADHLHLGEGETLAVDPSVCERSQALHRRFASAPAGAAAPARPAAEPAPRATAAAPAPSGAPLPASAPAPSAVPPPPAPASASPSAGRAASEAPARAAGGPATAGAPATAPESPASSLPTSASGAASAGPGRKWWTRLVGWLRETLGGR